ncbi:rod shape-determining protein MreC [Paenibacillus yanchengensis]|uniref:Cell shape-determining protein MreC n=1 Tax=Paenibacillus yanchengensis TaxID=2035833 RepID=A0ABW4YLS0_9BACL
MRNKRVIMLMIGVILFVAGIGYSITDRGELSLPEKIMKDTSAFVQQWFYKPAGHIAGFFSDIRNLRDIHQENERLRLTVAAYTRDKVHYNFTQKENERLKDMLHFTEQQRQLHNYNYLVAQVVAVSNDANNRAINIDIGSKHGVQRNMAVITVDGLVGLVSSVSPFSSTVTPITELSEFSSTFNSIAATALNREEESFGILSDYNKTIDRLIMTKISENDQLDVDDTVITSGFGGIYPRGLIVGTVESKQVGEYGLTHTAHIKMAAKLDHLTEVFVVQTANAVKMEDE